MLSLLILGSSAFYDFVNTSSAQAAFTTEMNGRKTLDGRARVNMTFDSDEAGVRNLDHSYYFLAKNERRNLFGDLKGQVSAKIEALTSSMLTLDVKVRNQTKDNFNASIVSLWLGIEQDVTGVEITRKGDVFRKAQVRNNLPGPGRISGVCISAVGCNGGNRMNKGLLALSDSFKINIKGDFGVAGRGSDFGEVTLTDSGSRWKVRDTGSYDVAGVPEPITMLGSGAALAFGALMKRRLSQASEQDS
ncbi:PEP-CTERM putative exosortase interaction domain protein [Synechococcus sp. PCC 7335]|nr:PEP-CTERM putative exosortase interaction domain protein [Synechococcus sp. PCC 7335]